MPARLTAAAALLAAGAIPSLAAPDRSLTDRPFFDEGPGGTVVHGDRVFESWEAFVTSDFFRDGGLRCGTPAPEARPGTDGGGGEDCTLSRTDPRDIYDPTVARYRIPVVVHVIRNSSGTTGDLSPEMVESQIDILNEDFLALPGSLGEDGTDAQVEFYLATEDPDGSPTTGITYSNNTTWFNDDGAYWETLSWDTNRYLNIYTNTASGYLGYVPGFPQDGLAGQTRDRVVCHYRAFGRDSPWFPYHKGRTAVHEVGHYLGLLHTFNGGCGSETACYTTADLICDTESQANPIFGCPTSATCGTPDPNANYMNYTDDLCMGEFTPEQARRLRCTLEHYRPDLDEVVIGCLADLDGSGAVAVEDLLVLLAAWGPCGECPEDLDGDGVVATSDLLLLLAAWGPCA